jgi:hypothetical protein
MPQSHCPLRPSVSALGIAPVFSPLLRPSPAASCLPLHLYNPVYTPSKGDALSLPLSPCCLPRSRCTAPFPGCRVIRTLTLFGMAPSASPLFSPHSASESPTARLIGNYCSVGVSAIHVSLVHVHPIACGRHRATWAREIKANCALCYTASECGCFVFPA